MLPLLEHSRIVDTACIEGLTFCSLASRRSSYTQAKMTFEFETNAPFVTAIQKKSPKYPADHDMIDLIGYLLPVARKPIDLAIAPVPKKCSTDDGAMKVAGINLQTFHHCCYGY